MTGVPVEAALELWASSLRDVKQRIRPLFTQERGNCSGGWLRAGDRRDG